jgi:hypothetical protein
VKIGFENKQSQVIFFICLSFIVIAFLFIYFDFNYFFALPLVLFVGMAYFFNPDYIWFSLAFLVPLSINPKDVELGNLSVSLPTEPILVLLVLIYFCGILFQY